MSAASGAPGDDRVGVGPVVLPSLRNAPADGRSAVETIGAVLGTEQGAAGDAPRVASAVFKAAPPDAGEGAEGSGTLGHGALGCGPAGPGGSLKAVTEPPVGPAPRLGRRRRVVPRCPGHDRPRARRPQRQLTTPSPDFSDIGRALAALSAAGETLAALPARLDEVVRAAQANAVAEAVLAVVDEGLHPDRDYLPAQAAAFLGVKRSTYNRIPEAELPRRRGGYARGVDLMAYRGDVSREEAEAYKAAQRAAVLRLAS